MSKKTVFISYSWDNEEHKDWVAHFAVQLENDGLSVILDQFDTEFGDQLPQFMEKAISENDFTLIICTPKYKGRSDNREGGVGYEGNIINGQIFSTGNQRKFIPILRIGEANISIPTALDGKKYVDLRDGKYQQSNYQSLLNSLLGQNDLRSKLRSKVGNLFSSIIKETEKLVAVSENIKSESEKLPAVPEKKIFSKDFEPIKITEIISDEISIPTNDGTRGSGLYRVPLRLSQNPPNRWKELVIHYWDNPPYFTNRHRPGIVECRGDKLILNGTTIEEVEGVHNKTLVAVINATNNAYQQEFNRVRELERAKQEFESQHKKKAEEIAKRIKFE
jgi:TIR domain